MTAADITALTQRLDALTQAVCMLAQNHGSRLSKSDLAERMGVHRNTLRARMQGKDFPQPGPDGKWALADVIAWEQNRGH